MNPSKVIMWAYKNASEGATTLADALGIKKLKHEGSTFVFTPDTLIINWGCSSLPEKAYCGQWVNHPQYINVSANKLMTFQALQGVVPIPDWTTNPVVAKEWNDVVIARMYLKGKDGDGIIIVEKGLDIPTAKCYTRFIAYEREYRVHVIAGKPVDVVRKIFKNGNLPEDMRIRTSGNGILFQREGITYHPSVTEVAVKAVQALGLDFGAVDVVSRGTNSWVLEVNSAPEMLPFITKVYAKEITKNWIKE